MPPTKRRSFGSDGGKSSKVSKAPKASLDPTADRILTWLLISKLHSDDNSDGNLITAVTAVNLSSLFAGRRKKCYDDCQRNSGFARW